DLNDFDVVFDVSADDEEYSLEPFTDLEIPVFVSSIKAQLAEMADPDENYGPIFGLNCLPTFLNRPLKEVSCLNEQDAETLKEVCQNLGWEYQLVKDRVGMVTPRIIFMIINEACYTVQEGTANMQDIDSSMKLGTAYPKGPFEWADEIGIADVYETLEALFLDTGDERYKICPLLKTKYLRQETFLG
ncbi:MAG: 3-hydroxyacyl-CoA dehydrogenase, partial [Bacteroidetes bacterium]|nr:3-hydroxyacyl-CoA dehydrogenase [Bacteroidota bacterium]